jgi:Cu/Zn superoxide dismutase
MPTGWKGIVASAGHFARMGVALAFAAAASLAFVNTAAAEEGVVKAIAGLHPTANHSVAGIARFTQVAGGVRVSATVEGLTSGKRGFPIHELGDCSAPDAASAGGRHLQP